MDINTENKINHNSKTKPLRIVILQWIFLIASTIVMAVYIKNPPVLWPGSDFFVLFSNAILYIPLISMVVITACLFIYSKISMRFVVPTALVLALTMILGVQMVIFIIVLKMWEVDIKDFYSIVSPDVKLVIGGNTPVIPIGIGLINMLIVAIFYGIPLLAVYIIHKLTRIES